MWFGVWPNSEDDEDDEVLIWCGVVISAAFCVDSSEEGVE